MFEKEKMPSSYTPVRCRAFRKKSEIKSQTSINYHRLSGGDVKKKKKKTSPKVNRQRKRSCGREKKREREREKQYFMESEMIKERTEGTFKGKKGISLKKILKL